MAVQNVSSLVGTLPLDNALARQLAEAQLGKYVIGIPTDNAALVKQANDTYAVGAQAGKVDLKAQAPAGSQPSTASPHGNYSHQAAQTAGTYYLPLDSDQVALTDRKGKKVLSGQHLGRVMNEKDPKYVSAANPEGFRFPELRQSLVEKHKLTQTLDGRWLAPVQSRSAGNVGDLIPGLTSASGALTGTVATQADVGQSSMDYVNRSSFLMPAMTVDGLATGGLAGLAGGFLMSNALKSTMAGSGVTGLSMSAGAMGSMSWSTKALGTVGTVGSVVGSAFGLDMSGMQFNTQAIIQSEMRQYKLDNLMGTIDNPGVSIESLIFMFMAAMGDQYEEKLREKMKETCIAEKTEERINNRNRKADMTAGLAQGIGSMFGPLGGMIGGMAGQTVKAGASKLNQLEAGLNGKTKSSTMLMQEVQMLMHKWKQLNEMMSNLLKAMHDMAMTPIRNLR